MSIPPVNPWFRFDWQFVRDVQSLRPLNSAVAIISVSPLLVSVSESTGIAVPPHFFLTWLAAIFYTLSWAITYFACPEFLREYRDFSAFKQREHSHRWIVWELVNNLKLNPNSRKLLKELVAKDVARPIKSKPECGRFFTGGLESLKGQAEAIAVFKPVQVSRDIFLPFQVDSSKYLLEVREQDSNKENIQRELFWVVYSEAAKRNHGWRITVWLLILLAAILFGLTIALNVVKVI